MDLDRPHPFTPFPGTDAETFIQWKGTQVCLDLYCSCSPREPRHFDADFAYYLRCPACGAVYETGTQLKMRRLAADEQPAMEPAESVDE